MIGLPHSGYAAMAILVFALGIRFLATIFQQLSKKISSLDLKTDQAARSYGATFFQVITEVHWPRIRGPFFLSLGFVVLEVAKEMPITLILRPFSTDTLATKIYEYTSEGEWELAALPALILVLLGGVSLILTVSMGKIAGMRSEYA